MSDLRLNAPKFDFRSSGPHGWILETGMEGKGRERKGRGEKKGKGSEREKERRRRQWEEEGEIGMGKRKGGILCSCDFSSSASGKTAVGCAGR